MAVSGNAKFFRFSQFSKFVLFGHCKCIQFILMKVFETHEKKTKFSICVRGKMHMTFLGCGRKYKFWYGKIPRGSKTALSLVPLKPHVGYFLVSAMCLYNNSALHAEQDGVNEEREGEAEPKRC
jgi:hypothetical protein